MGEIREFGYSFRDYGRIFVGPFLFTRMGGEEMAGKLRGVLLSSSFSLYDFRRTLIVS